jgi:hypothetical protein
MMSAIKRGVMETLTPLLVHEVGPKLKQAFETGPAPFWGLYRLDFVLDRDHRPYLVGGVPSPLVVPPEEERPLTRMYRNILADTLDILAVNDLPRGAKRGGSGSVLAADDLKACAALAAEGGKPREPDCTPGSPTALCRGCRTEEDERNLAELIREEADRRGWQRMYPLAGAGMVRSMGRKPSGPAAEHLQRAEDKFLFLWVTAKCREDPRASIWCL